VYPLHHQTVFTFSGVIERHDVARSDLPSGESAPKEHSIPMVQGRLHGIALNFAAQEGGPKDCCKAREHAGEQNESATASTG
jgi:hypothetical protein